MTEIKMEEVQLQTITQIDNIKEPVQVENKDESIQLTEKFTEFNHFDFRDALDVNIESDELTKRSYPYPQIPEHELKNKV